MNHAIAVAVEKAYSKYQVTGDLNAAYQMMKHLGNKEYDEACAELERRLS